MKPLIGITIGETLNKEFPWAAPVHGQARTYMDAVKHAGGIPVMISFLEDEVDLRQVYELCSGLLISGGNDIDPMLYTDQPSPKTVEISRPRDDQEVKLIKWALDDDKPVLGICRGLQLINVVMGGSLHQHLDDMKGIENHHESTDRESITDLSHELDIEPDSLLAHILGVKKISANAHHHQAADRIGKGLRVVARTPDKIVEAIEMPDKTFVLAVQSHPESLESEAEPNWRKPFASFVKAAQEYKSAASLIAS